MNVIELIRGMKDRPAMHIGRHSIFFMKAYIDGWYFRNIDEDVQMEILNDFSLWIDDSFFNSSERTCSWCEFLYWMSANDESKALDKFFILFEQFLTEKADKNHLNS
ncbi:hypothetical protein K0E65_12450 [Bacteroides fragilis]|jgi:hypothetical protein|uniref:hypothetical protein n=1 Tax=Bacteroides fragilis TaxID=817 RepID=UPI001F418AE4|nr:hypothetical protein [Bacteroides fragilis]MCE8615316.1 hypothetical protein [Bacteroides fragilis]MCZ2602397.1 hypothetical protein [Bacteroides fragilis]UHZ85845.1 hypothetical protein K0E65_12450 [Bacteroides fragilis]